MQYTSALARAQLRGVGRDLLRGVPVYAACCEAAPPRVARKTLLDFTALGFREAYYT